MFTFKKKELLLIKSCPAPGSGVHSWTFQILKMLCAYYACDESLSEAAHIIFNQFATRPVDDGEIQRQIGNARRSHSWRMVSPSAGEQLVRKTRWRIANVCHIETIVRGGTNLERFQARSPVPIGNFQQDNGDLLHMLFPGNPLLCCSKHINSHETRALSSWGDLNGHQFIVPSPMSSVWGKTKNDKQSQRCLENTGPRRFLVIEFDFKIIAGEAAEKHNLVTENVHSLDMSRMVERLNADGITVHDMCAALIEHLAELMPPALVVHSGGKSLHSWFFCAGIEENVVRRFMSHAVGLGADPYTWTPCQFVRMPGGIRNNGTRQNIVHFNPEALS